MNDKIQFSDSLKGTIDKEESSGLVDITPSRIFSLKEMLGRIGYLNHGVPSKIPLFGLCETTKTDSDLEDGDQNLLPPFNDRVRGIYKEILNKMYEEHVKVNILQVLENVDKDTIYPLTGTFYLDSYIRGSENRFLSRCASGYNLILKEYALYGKPLDVTKFSHAVNINKYLRNFIIEIKLFLKRKFFITFNVSSYNIFTMIMRTGYLRSPKEWLLEQLSFTHNLKLNESYIYYEIKDEFIYYNDFFYGAYQIPLTTRCRSIENHMRGNHIQGLSRKKSILNLNSRNNGRDHLKQIKRPKK